jgi:hypothetical protein
MASKRPGDEAVVSVGDGRWGGCPLNCESSGMNFSWKSNFPARPVLSMTGRSRTTCCII